MLWNGEHRSGMLGGYHWTSQWRSRKQMGMERDGAGWYSTRSWRAMTTRADYVTKESAGYFVSMHTWSNSFIEGWWAMENAICRECGWNFLRCRQAIIIAHAN